MTPKGKRYKRPNAFFTSLNAHPASQADFIHAMQQDRCFLTYPIQHYEDINEHSWPLRCSLYMRFQQALEDYF